ncbi:hypothetical protein CEXT_365211 [Caerostris extrusa]|uniref:Uncharacterized protein n=1 Tax=Caerostris extrusa TaxID=172846 RepID=A0AAV4Q9K9_CAEEX|nr:hypothetical protein CEXT_365211 [Caerostris extrusa]
MSLRFAPTKLEPQSLYISLHILLRDHKPLEAAMRHLQKRSVLILTKWIAQAPFSQNKSNSEEHTSNHCACRSRKLVAELTRLCIKSSQRNIKVFQGCFRCNGKFCSSCTVTAEAFDCKVALMMPQSNSPMRLFCAFWSEWYLLSSPLCNCGPTINLSLRSLPVEDFSRSIECHAEICHRFVGNWVMLGR